MHALTTTHSHLFATPGVVAHSACVASEEHATPVGASVGANVGPGVGALLGNGVGFFVGLRCGDRDGRDVVGSLDGRGDGCAVGKLVGDCVGFTVGLVLGLRVGRRVGGSAFVGAREGEVVSGAYTHALAASDHAHDRDASCAHWYLGYVPAVMAQNPVAAWHPYDTVLHLFPLRSQSWSSYQSQPSRACLHVSGVVFTGHVDVGAGVGDLVGCPANPHDCADSSHTQYGANAAHCVWGNGPCVKSQNAWSGLHPYETDEHDVFFLLHTRISIHSHCADVTAAHAACDADAGDDSHADVGGGVTVGDPDGSRSVVTHAVPVHVHHSAWLAQSCAFQNGVHTNSRWHPIVCRL